MTAEDLSLKPLTQYEDLRPSLTVSENENENFKENPHFVQVCSPIFPPKHMFLQTRHIEASMLNEPFPFDSSYKDELFLQSMQSLQIASEMVLWDLASSSSSSSSINADSSSDSTLKR